MRAYGLPRNDDISSPDAYDVCAYGLKSSAGRRPGPGGDTRASNKTSTKARARRYWKRVARAEGKAACSED